MKKPKPHRKPGATAHPAPPAGILTRGAPPPPAKPAPKKPAPKKPVPVHHGAPPPGILHRGTAPPVKTKSKKKPRALGGVPCVAAAIAACLEIPAADVLPYCSGDPDGDLIEDVLERMGVPGFPVCFPGSADHRSDGGGFGGFAAATTADVVPAPGDLTLILGVELPGPHAVLAVDGWWWSWDAWWSPAEFPDAVIEEAWALT